jgi:hypothetical protein
VLAELVASLILKAAEEVLREESQNYEVLSNNAKYGLYMALTS